ncbi:MAG: D-aminoacyl-tRNA deacylase [Chloroflexota bacterium]
MRIILQRVSQASVTAESTEVSAIQRGFLLLVGITHTDTEKEADYLARKIAGIRLFEDEDGKMNQGLADVGGSVLAVSQFTLYADARKGRRPSFINAARPDLAQPLYEYFCQSLTQEGITVKQGIFQTSMKVSLVNDGPVTLILDTAELMKT